MIVQQTFETKNCADELATLSRAIDLIGKKRIDEALRVLIVRHDQLLAAPILKRYDPREVNA